MLAQFPGITTPQFSKDPHTHTIQHYISTKSLSIHARPRRLSPAKLTLAQSEFNKMMDFSICCSSSSPWASLLHTVPKASEDWGPCSDYHRLNALPRLTDTLSLTFIILLSVFPGSKIFSEVDLIRGYHQSPVALEDIAKTAVVTLFGVFEFLRMPFVLKNAVQTLQRLMDSVSQSLDFVFIYLDVILVASASLTKHRKHLLRDSYSKNCLISVLW